MSNQVGTRNEPNRIEWLKRMLEQIPAGSSILDAGAGEQRFKAFCGHLNYVAQDFAQYDGKGDQTGLQLGAWDQTKLDIVSDITAIPRPDESFHAVLCVEVLEHVPDPIAAIREFSRLLKPKGQLLLTAPFSSLTHLAPYHFYTGFNRYFYQTHLENLGFESIQIESNGNYFEFLAQEIRRVPEVAQRYASQAPRRWEGWAMRAVLAMLERFSKHDRHSADLLHFGYHVKAIKKQS